MPKAIDTQTSMNELPIATEVSKTCKNCEGLYDDSDFEQGRPWWRCGIKPHMENLKGFPFKTPQKCFVLAWHQLIDWDAEGRKLQKQWDDADRYDF